MKLPPEKSADQFFKSLMHNQCHVCWQMFTRKTQNQFLKWTLNDIYKRNPEAAREAKIGIPEVKILFQNNDPALMKSFWKRFFFQSGANDFFRHGYYDCIENNGKKAIIQVTLKYPDGRVSQVKLTMIKEWGSWKLGYLESGLRF